MSASRFATSASEMAARSRGSRISSALPPRLRLLLRVAELLRGASTSRSAARSPSSTVRYSASSAATSFARSRVSSASSATSARRTRRAARRGCRRPRPAPKRLAERLQPVARVARDERGALEHDELGLDLPPLLALAPLALEPAREHVADLVEELALELVHERERARPLEQLRARLGARADAAHRVVRHLRVVLVRAQQLGRRVWHVEQPRPLRARAAASARSLRSSSAPRLASSSRRPTSSRRARPRARCARRCPSSWRR